jgi:hypothetical protein
MSIGCKKAPPAPGSEIKTAHCSGDSVKFTLREGKVTIAIDDLDFQYHLGVRGKPKLDIENTIFGKQYIVYCYDWEQKMEFFPRLPY